MILLKSWRSMLVLIVLLALTGGKAWSTSTLPPVYQWINPLTGASVPLDENWKIIVNSKSQKSSLLDIEFYNSSQDAILSIYSIALPVTEDQTIDPDRVFKNLITLYIDLYNEREKEYNESDMPFNMNATHDIITLENKEMGFTHKVVEYSDNQETDHAYAFYFLDDYKRVWILDYHNIVDSETSLQQVLPFIRSVINADAKASSDLPTFIPGTYKEPTHYPPAQQVVQSVRQNGMQPFYQWENPFTGHIIPVASGWELVNGAGNPQCADHDLADFAESFCFYHQPSNTALSLKRRAPQPLNPYGMVMIDYRNQGAETVAQNDALTYAVSMQSFGPYQLPLLQYFDSATNTPQSYKVGFDTLKTMWEIEATTTLAIDDPKLSHMITLLFASTQEESDIDAQDIKHLHLLPVTP